jgi:hypothetical protein
MMRIAVLVAALTTTCAAIAFAQDAPRIEAGPEISFFQVKYWPTDTGAGAHVAVALTPRIAIETRVRLFPEERETAVARGGRTLQVFAGPKATFASRSRYAVYGVLLPGIVHFSQAVTNVDRDVVTIGGATHFALDMGIGASMRLADRWVAHADWTGPVYGVHGFAHLSDFPPAAERGILDVVVDPTMQATFEVSAGISYRAGSIGAREAGASPRGGWQLGGDIGAVAYAPYVTVSPDVMIGRRAGLFVSHPITSWMDADGGADVFLRTDRGHSTNEGGRISHALGGVKVGRRFGRIGYFVKLRGGVRSHSDGLVAEPSLGHPEFGRIYRPVLDLGTVIELAITPRLVWRTDAGDLMSFHPSVRIEIQGMRIDDYAMPVSDTIAVSSGIAWRFGRVR